MPRHRLASGDPSGKEEEHDRDRKGRDGEDTLVELAGHGDQELNGKAEEEKKVEFEEGDVDLREEEVSTRDAFEGFSTFSNT